MADTHITGPGVHIFGLNPAQRLRRCLDHAAKHHGDAVHLFLLGDLTDSGLHSQYKILKEILDNQPFDRTLMLGNHDCRGTFLDIFPDISRGYQQGVINFERTKVLYLDTLENNNQTKDAGYICEERLRWLKFNLLFDGLPSIILTHHHLLKTGFTALDEINLINGLEVADILSESKKCQMVISGHVHRTSVSNYKGVVHATIKSPCHQMPMVLGSSSILPSINERGGYGILILNEKSSVLHHVDVEN